MSNSHDIPDDAEVLNAMYRHSQRGGIPGFGMSFQLRFFHGLLEPKYTDGMSKEAIGKKTSRLRKEIMERFQLHLLPGFRPEHMLKLGFGPQKVVDPLYLQKIPWTTPDSEDEEAKKVVGVDDDDGHDGDGDGDGDDEGKAALGMAGEMRKSKKGNKRSAKRHEPGMPQTERQVILAQRKNAVSLESHSTGDQQSNTHEAVMISSPPASPVSTTQGQKRKLDELNTEQQQETGAKKRVLATTAETDIKASVSEHTESDDSPSYSRTTSSRTTPAFSIQRRRKNGDRYDIEETRRHISKIERNIIDAALLYCDDFNIGPNARSTFVGNPSTELKEFYKTLASDDFVQSWALEQHGVATFKQSLTLAGLFGVGIVKYVFLQSEPHWTVSNAIPASLLRAMADANEKDYGVDPKGYLESVAQRQSYDKVFIASDVAPLASDKVQELIGLLRPHLVELTKAKASGVLPAATSDTPPRKHIKPLEKAFRDAMMLKQRLEADEFGPFEYRWPRAGDEIDLTHHRVVGESLEARRVLHPLLPGIWSTNGDVPQVFSEAVVIPSIPRSGPGNV